MSKKFFAAVFLFVLLSAVTASGEVVGRFTMVNVSEQAATDQMKFTGTIDIETYVGVDPSTVTIKFYDSLTTLLLALSKGEIDSITVPRPVGRYILENNYGDFNIKGFNWWIKAKSSTLNFGFINEEIAKKFNEVIKAMKQDGTLPALEEKYIENFGTITAETFENFDDAETITVAVTGDIPPIDYVDASGNPAGFNVAVLKEIGKRLHVNIKTIQVDTGARIAALTSGRADAIFWMRGTIYSKPEQTATEMPDKAIILSEPYYLWSEQYFICKRKK